MKNVKKTGVFILWSILAVLQPATGGCAGLTLHDAIKNAIESNFLLKAAQHRVTAAAERITLAESGFFPKLFISEGYQVTTNPMWAFGTKLNQEIIERKDFDPGRLNDPSAMENFSTLLWMTWPLFDSGQTWYGSQQAELACQSSAAGLEQVRQEIILQTVIAYTDLVFVKESVAVVDQGLLTAQAHLRLIENRYNSGLTVKSDLLRARVHTSELEQQRVEVNSEFRIARAALGSVMGDETPCEVLPVTLLAQKKLSGRPLSEWIEMALAGRPCVRQVKFQHRIARKEIKKSRSAHWPSVNLAGRYEINTDDFEGTADNYTVGANVTLNLFSGNAIAAREREAVSRCDEISATVRALMQTVRLETRAAYYRVRSAEKRIRSAEFSVDEAVEVLRIVGDRYDNGQVSIVSLLDAEMTVIRARNNLNMALKDHIQSRAHLALAVGDLGEMFH